MNAHLFSFYVPGMRATDGVVEIAGDENRHLHGVLRLKIGETIRLTNGLGLAAVASLESSGAARSVGRVTAIECDSPPARRLVLALGLLQRSHFETAIAQCVEVGITDLLPVLAERCHVRRWSAAAAERAGRIAVSAMKQSGRSWLPVIHDAIAVDALARSLGDYRVAVLGEGEGGPLGRTPAGGDSLVLVGPEAGFTAREAQALVAAGARRVSVSAHRLRAETAAVVLVSALAQALGTERPDAN